MEQKDSFNTASIMTDFANLVNSQSNYNQNGKINAVPLVTYHNVGLETNAPYSFRSRR
ncbi:MAG: hypothetical protein WCF23_16490 [Candidatus Nitrosopolaris sp.]